MKNLRIIESCLAMGQHAEAGSILQNVPAHVAADLIQNGRAVLVPARQEVVVNRDPQVESRDPVPAKKTKAK